MKTIVTAAPTVEVVSIDEAKEHLRVTCDEEDSLIAALVSTAREAAEHLTDKALGEQTLTVMLDGFVDSVELTITPVGSIASIKYLDDDGIEQTVAPSEYALDGEMLTFADAYSFPSTNDAAGCVRIAYAAGYTAVTCPASIKQWILLTVGAMYENREAAADKQVTEIPFAARLLDRYRVWSA